MSVDTKEIPMTDMVPASEVAPPQPREPNILVVAEHPSELEAAQNSLIGWADARIAALNTEREEADKALAEAKVHKWRSGPFAKVVKFIGEQQDYMGKMRDALAAGYCIVPNFPVDIIAIRINEGTSPAYSGTSRTEWGSPSSFEQVTDALPAGHGQWVDPLPKRTTWDEVGKKDGKDITLHCARPVGWQDPRFPIHLAKPRVMDATQRAMALKCFDRIGVLPGSKAKVDPIVVGQIMRPRKSGYDLGNRWHHHVTTFLLAWFIDTKDLG